MYDYQGQKKKWNELGIDIYTLLCTKYITNENILGSSGNSTWCSVVTKMG